MKLKDFKDISITIGYFTKAKDNMFGHGYSLEFNDDNTFTLHEPHNSNNGKVYTIDELFKLINVENFVVMVL